MRVRYLSMPPLAAFDLDSKVLENMKVEFARRRDYVYERFSKIHGITVPKPVGAFYIFPNISHYFGKSHGEYVIHSAMDMSTFLLESAHSAVVPGEAFGAPQNIRVSYATSMENLQSALDQIEVALQMLH